MNEVVLEWQGILQLLQTKYFAHEEVADGTEPQRRSEMVAPNAIPWLGVCVSWA